MTLQELYDSLAPSFPPSIHKDLKTAVRVLAKALQYPDPQHCPLDQCNQPLPSLYRLIETSLTAEGKSAHTIRNTKNNLSRLFRLAEAQHLFSLQPLPLTRRHSFMTKPRRLSDEFQHRAHTLMYADWPPPLQEAFTAFETWATAALVPGRDASFRKRARSVENYRHAFEGYFGFLHRIHHCAPLTFEHLFDLTLVTAYVHWHVNELHKRPTVTIHKFLIYMLALTRQYRPLPALREQLAALQKTLPKPKPVHNKDDAWVSLATLQEIGRTLWPSTHLHQVRKGPHRPGARFATRAALSLMFQLWTYIPYRSRNMREMRLGENLQQDPQGQWWITFRGEQLKIARRRGTENYFRLPFPPALVSLLQQYLEVWRPLLLQDSPPSSLVFLTEQGNPFTQIALRLKTSRHVYSYTGKHWHPHMIRTVWATEWIRNTQNYHHAAIMLNDKLETVLENYAHLRDENVAEEVYEVLDRRNGQRK